MAAGGLSAVTVEGLARALGVTKGSFYWHFTDRAALLTAVLDTWQQRTEDIIAGTQSHATVARARLAHLADVTLSGDGLAAELAIREWARHDTQVGVRLRRVDDRRMQYLRSLFGEFCSGSDEIEARSMLLYSLRMGDYFIAARHGRKSRQHVLQCALAHLLR